jgi:riboflavin synthase
MFTGIVEEMGTVRSIERRGGNQRTTLDAKTVMSDIHVGDSISLAGVCHTVVGFDTRGFWVESVDETLRLTTLGKLKVGSRINLERSLRLSDRLGGHLVAGHVDGVGKLVNRQDMSGSVELTIEAGTELSPYIAKKGSVAVDGISLTVASTSNASFSIAVIPHTLEVTTISELRVGDDLNLEVDMFARYLERLVSAGRANTELTQSGIEAMGY